MKITGLYIYPIKSLRPISLTEAEVTSKGLKYDREMMLIDSKNRFLSQREIPQMCLIDVKMAENHWLVSCENEQIEIPFVLSNDVLSTAKIWDDTLQTIVFPKPINEWFSDIFGREIRLVKLFENRQIDLRYANNGDFTAFSDGYPILLANEKSLDFLNQKLSQPIEMLRFRPNIVVSGNLPFEEDNWKKLKINDVILDLVKPCSRCVVTTIDPNTAEKRLEPLKTLAEFRTLNNKIMFGQNVIPRTEGKIFLDQHYQIF